MLYHVLLDTVEGEDPEGDKLLVEFMKENNVTTTPTGQAVGGGWSEIEYFGTENVLKQMIDKFWDDEDLYEYIEKV